MIFFVILFYIFAAGCFLFIILTFLDFILAPFKKRNKNNDDDDLIKKLSFLLFFDKRNKKQ